MFLLIKKCSKLILSNIMYYEKNKIWNYKEANYTYIFLLWALPEKIRWSGWLWDQKFALCFGWCYDILPLIGLLVNTPNYVDIFLLWSLLKASRKRGLVMSLKVKLVVWMVSLDTPDCWRSPTKLALSTTLHRSSLSQYCFKIENYLFKLQF